MSFILLLTVYGRFFRLYMFTALAPLPLASFAGEGTVASGKAFLKSYIGVCMEGAVIVLAWLVGRKHSRTWRFSDVNYAAASEDDRRGIFLSYGGVLNSLPTDAAAKITIIHGPL